MSEQKASSRVPSAPLHWRVRACRWLLRVLLFVWGTVVVNIFTGTIANLNTTTTDTPLAKLFIIRLALTYPLPVWSSLGLLAFLTLLSWLGSRDKQATPARPLSEQDRVHLLGRLRLLYEQLLTQSLEGAVQQLELGLAERPAAVQNPVSLVMRLSDQPEQLLPSHTSIMDVYTRASKELLILGEPGAGKSTLLLKLARYLVQQAEQDANQLVPVFLPLSSWAEHKRPLHEWLSEEIARFYDVSRRLSQQWIEAEQVFPLLDGLDEMEEAARPACIAAINTYHHDHLRPLVVCSRTSEYDAATRYERLTLNLAVVVRPLEPRQVNAYLANLGKPLAGLRAALKANALLQEVATTPLLLRVLMLTYHGTSVRVLSQQEALLREQIWTDYVQRMVRDKGDARRYPLAVIIGWLRWLASEMRQQNQAIFFLERLQPDWLPTGRRNQYRWSVKLVFGLVFGLIFGLFAGLVAGLAGGLGSGLIFGLLAGLAGGLVFGLGSRRDTEVEPAEILTWSWKNFRSALGFVLVFGLVAGLIFGLLAELVLGLSSGLGSGLVLVLVGWLVIGLVFGLVVGPFGGLLFGFSGKQLTERSMFSPNEGIRRSTKNGLLSGLVVVLLVVLLGGLIGELGSRLDSGLIGGLVVGLVVGPVVGLGFGLGAAVQHYLLRFWLARSGVFPWRAVPFLEDATARILLRRVGGGYSFVHRLLLDYFADAYAGSSSASLAAQSTQPSHP